MSEADVHSTAPDEFVEHVRSFEFWFGAVQGYLDGTEYGHTPASAPELADADRERLITVLCSYCVGETAALEGAGALIRLAPSRLEKVFLSTQTVDEGRHLEVLAHRLGELGVASVEREVARRAHPSLLAFKQRLLGLVSSGEWEAALFAQNVILEAMEFAAFHHHARAADPRTREILLGIIKDERRHMGFGENELGRRTQADARLRDRLRGVRAELEPLVLETFEHTLEAIGAPRAEGGELAGEYRSAVARLGVA
jgi:1,2-phenylacetyl-CoA epoxidase catalytic subunit